MNDTQRGNQAAQATTDEQRAGEATMPATGSNTEGNMSSAREGDDRTDADEEREDEQSATDAADASDTDVLLIEFDQLDTDLVEFDALVEQDIITVDSDGADDIRQMHAQRETTRDMRGQFKASDEESRSRLRTAFQGAIDDLREAWHRTRARIEDRRRGKGPEGTEAHP